MITQRIKIKFETCPQYAASISMEENILKQAWSLAGIGLLGALAVAGWMRKPESPLLDPGTQTVAANSSLPAAYAAPHRYQRVSYAPVRGNGERQVVRRERPLSHSVAIVAGTAGAGAAIGALAGHGRGAAIGALSGGAAGFIYDRLTHNRGGF